MRGGTLVVGGVRNRFLHYSSDLFCGFSFMTAGPLGRGANNDDNAFPTKSFLWLTVLCTSYSLLVRTSSTCIRWKRRGGKGETAGPKFSCFG